MMCDKEVVVEGGRGDVSNIRVIRLPSDLSRERAPDVRRLLDQALQDGAAMLALDMSAVASIGDATGASLIRASKEAREAGGDLRLFSLSLPVTEFLSAMGLDDVFLRFANEQDAVASFFE